MKLEKTEKPYMFEYIKLQKKGYNARGGGIF